MDHDHAPRVESPAIGEFARVMGTRVFGSERRAADEPSAARPLAGPGRLALRPDRAKNELGRLVLTLVKLLHDLLEKQALERVEGGALTPLEVERLGLTLMRQAQEIDEIRRAFRLEQDDLNIDLGPLGKLL